MVRVSFLPDETQTMVRVNCQNGDGGVPGLVISIIAAEHIQLHLPPKPPKNAIRGTPKDLSRKITGNSGFPGRPIQGTPGNGFRGSKWAIWGRFVGR